MAKLAGQKPYENPSQKVVADHIRAASFLIADGITPSNEGRGYVLRRILRRAIRHGYKLGLSEAFFHKLVAPLVAEMGAAFPQLQEQQAAIEKTIKQEEESFATTLDKGMKLLEEAIGKIKDGTIPGEVVFKLYDTYGFPLDLTADIARERNLKLDEAGYEREMEAQRTRARAASQFKAGTSLKYDGAATEFVGYDALTAEAKVHPSRPSTRAMRASSCSTARPSTPKGAGRWATPARWGASRSLTRRRLPGAPSATAAASPPAR